MGRKLMVGLGLAALLSGLASHTEAKNLDSVLTGLFAGKLNVGTLQGLQITGTSPTASSLNIGTAFNSFRSQIPVPSASAAFTYEFDKDADIWVRTSDSLGPLFTERALTLGQGKFAASLTYTHAELDTLYGQPLSKLQRVVPVGAQILANSPNGNNPIGISDDVMRVNINMDATFDSIFMFFAYGINDDWDVSIAMPLNRVAMSSDGTGATANIVDPNSDSSQPGNLNYLQFASKDGTPLGRSLSQSFNESAFGPGDIFLRTKYRFLRADRDTYFPDLAGGFTFTIPTGGYQDFLGFQYPTGTFAFIASRSFSFVSPHFNAGYSVRSAQDVGQAFWGAGFEVAFWDRRLTLIPDILAFYDTNRLGPLEDSIYQYSMGLKYNPWGQLVLAANFQFPLNNDGLRANIIYTGQVEYSF